MTLLAFGGLTDDAQSVLAAVYGLALVRSECRRYFYRRTGSFGRLELRIAAFADRNGWSGPLHESEFSLRHENSLPPKGCANETAPVPLSASAS
jgi:hypothetical protein